MVHTRPSPVTANALAGRKPGYQNAVTGGRASGGQREQRAPADVFRRAVLVVRDDRPPPPPCQVAAPDAAVDEAEVAAEVQQRQVVERHPGAFGERGQFGPFRAEGFGGGPARPRPGDRFPAGRTRAGAAGAAPARPRSARSARLARARPGPGTPRGPGRAARSSAGRPSPCSSSETLMSWLPGKFEAVIPAVGGDERDRIGVTGLDCRDRMLEQRDIPNHLVEQAGIASGGVPDEAFQFRQPVGVKHMPSAGNRAITDCT